MKWQRKKDSFLLMEKWSFKRKGLSTTTNWDQKVTIRTQVFDMIPIEEKYNKALYIYDMVPGLDEIQQGEEDPLKLICIEVRHQNHDVEADQQREYLLGFLMQEEYDLLVEYKPSL